MNSSPKRLRIACVGTRGVPSTYSGLESSCESLYSNLADKGHEVTVYCRRDPSETGKIYRGIKRIELPALRTRSFETLSHTAVSLAHALATANYDIVHLHALAPGIFSRACRLRGIPTVATVQGLDWQRAKWRGIGSKIIRFGEQSIVRNATKVIVVSRDLQQYFQKTYGLQTKYIPNGVEGPTERDSPDPGVLQKFKLEPRQYLLYLGRLVPEKRVQDLLIAFRRLDSRLNLIITGGSGYTDQYASTLRSLAAQDSRVIFTGLQNKAAVHALISNAKAYVSASEIEGLPMSVLECMWHGTPVILSDIPPHKQLFESAPGFDLFFQPGSVEGIATQIRKFIDNESRYRAIAEDSRKWVLKDYSWSRVAEQTQELFFEIVANLPRMGLNKLEHDPVAGDLTSAKTFLRGSTDRPHPDS